ncbi:MAG: hypothetical protein V4591_06295 [Bdellovibrionota bacterium]
MMRKETLKELYHEMRQRIRIIIQLLGKPEPDKANPLPEGNSFNTISNLINSIMSSAQFEPENQYKDAIIEIISWLNAAFHKEYLNTNKACFPNPIFAIKKGAEILHSFFHRDLRRKQMSSEEHEIYRNYMQLIRNLPDPQKNKLNQNEADNMIDDLLKSS